MIRWNRIAVVPPESARTFRDQQHSDHGQPHCDQRSESATKRSPCGRSCKTNIQHTEVIQITLQKQSNQKHLTHGLNNEQRIVVG
jgi:hypothetical protein